jgi:hypothetical protein
MVTVEEKCYELAENLRGLEDDEYSFSKALSQAVTFAKQYNCRRIYDTIEEFATGSKYEWKKQRCRQALARLTEF